MKLNVTKASVLNMFIGSLLSTAILVPVLVLMDFFEVTPYEDVTPITVTQDWNEINVTTNFYKHDGCKLRRLTVFGKSLGLWEEIPYVDLDYKPADQPVSRVIGWNTLHLKLSVSNMYYDEIQIRTRHECYDRDRLVVVDEIFQVLEPIGRDEYGHNVFGTLN